MAAIQIGKYKRPGIFFEEFDSSIIPPPPAPAPLANTLVVGFSKKGPINTPILISNVDDLEKIYGPLDRTLERKGSFFHRTIAKVLESSPVLAMNLLPTSDTLDRVEYRSLSTATTKLNSDVIEIPFRKIHDTSSFWTRDTDTFIDNIKDEPSGADRLLHITNIGNRYASIFIYKSKLTGFNQSLIEYYGTADKVPPYLSPLDYASDYLVDVLCISGDWSNYNELAVDVRWSAYFTKDGLRKDAAGALAQNRNVNTLAYYEGLSLIPYFRNADGRNIFIETVINNETDRTGLFCAFNADKLEGAYRGDMVDIIGNNFARNNSLIDVEQDEVNFLSYQETITEQNPFSLTTLDVADGTQEVIALGPSISAFSINSSDVSNFTRQTATATDGTVWTGRRPIDVYYNYNTDGKGVRTTYMADEIVRGIKFASYSTIVSTSSMVVAFDMGTVSLGTDANRGSTWSLPYFVVNGQRKFISGPTVSLLQSLGNVNFSVTFSISRLDYTNTGSTQTFYTTFYLNSNTGAVEKAQGTENGVLPLLPSSNDVVLGYLEYKLNDNIGSSGKDANGRSYFGVYSGPNLDRVAYYYDVAIGGATAPNGANVTLGFTNSFTEIKLGTDYTVSYVGGSITVTFLNTAVTDTNGGSQNTSIYSAHRKMRIFNNLVSLLDSSAKTKMVMLKDLYTQEKFSLANSTISNIVTNTSSNKSFTLDLGLGFVPSDIQRGNLVFYKIDNEFFNGDRGFGTDVVVAGLTQGVIGKYSEPYLSFVDGNINTGDYFYTNFISIPTRVVFTTSEKSEPVIVFQGPSIGTSNNSKPWSTITGTESIIVPSSTSNYKTFTLLSAATNSIVDPITGTYFVISSVNSQGYLVNKSTSLEDLGAVSQIWNAEERRYIRSYTLPSNTPNGERELQVNFTNDDLSTISLATASLNKNFTIISDLSNLKQTIEIYEPTGYIPVDNKVLVEANRYPEIKVGHFLQAKVDTDMLASGETGRRLTRILNKKSYSANPFYTEITCDSAVQKFEIEGTMQTLAYTTIDEYATAYKAIRLKGFRMREDSIPDGSEETQSGILNMVAKGTPIFKALVNKDAIDFRYVVDSFGLGLTEDSKQQLVDICGERLDCFGFINMPSMRMFKNSANPSFTNPDGTINTAYIANGGNEEANPRFLYSFGKGKGVSSVGYFLPYLVVNDNGRPAEIPPAMFVASTYLRKITGANPSLLPWTIAAGVNNGRILNITGVEQNFSFEDIENLNLAQMNPIVFKKNRGFVIETENTAQVIYKSALSYIHVREVLIELERELSAMLLDYQWRFNTADTRAEIKLKADSICEKYVNKNGLYNYFNKCDEENNTPDLIDRQIGVIDTYVEPIKGMGIIVNNITILRTGAIEAGGFA